MSFDVHHFSFGGNGNPGEQRNSTAVAGCQNSVVLLVLFVMFQRMFRHMADGFSVKIRLSRPVSLATFCHFDIIISMAIGMYDSQLR